MYVGRLHHLELHSKSLSSLQDILMNIKRFSFEKKKESFRKHIPHRSPLFQYLGLQNGIKIINY